MSRSSHQKLTVTEARALSAALCPLADELPDLWIDLDAGGYGAPLQVIRESIREIAGTDQNYERVVQYWVEYAKERLAGLKGPMDILRGELPEASAYRSPLLEELRRCALLFNSDGPIVSPQIEPTLKRYVEMMPSSQSVQRKLQEIKTARASAAQKLNLAESEEFQNLESSARYALLATRYTERLGGNGFAVSHVRRDGMVFDRLSQNRRWKFCFVDRSGDGMTGGMLDTTLVITLPNNQVHPQAVSRTAVATLPPWDLVPEFNAVCGFDKNSYGQMCLAADANAFLATGVFERVDRLLA